MANQPDPKKTAFRAKVTVGSADIEFEDIIDLVIVSELNMPDSFAMTLGSSDNVRTKVLPKIKLQDKIEAKLWFQNDDADVAFIGELTRVEPIASNRGATGTFTVLRGYNSMHGLARGKRSCTYAEQTDAQIVEQVLKRNSALKLKADFGKEPPKIKYEHVYQHNKTDLQFLLDRATRTGYFILVRDDRLLYQKRDVTPSGLKLKTAAARKQGDDKKIISLEDFVPRLSTAHQVTEVQTRFWDARKRMHITGKAPQAQGGGGAASMGTETGKSAIQERYPESVMHHYTTAFYSQEEGNAVAEAILEERILSYVTADGSCPGEPRLKPAIVVEVESGNPQFDGKYFVTRVRHRYRTGDAHSFTTDFHAKRDATEKAQQSNGATQA